MGVTIIVIANTATTITVKVWVVRACRKNTQCGSLSASVRRHVMIRWQISKVKFGQYY